MFDPTCCPFCGGSHLATSAAAWWARSMEPDDKDNVTDLDEHQCHDCGVSFWT